MRHFALPGRILRSSEDFWLTVRSGQHLAGVAWSLFLATFVFLGCYGVLMGLGGGPLQALASAIKLPILFLLTLSICLPALHLLHMVFGSKQSVLQQVVLMLAAFAVTSALLLGFAPVIAFFMMTTRSYPFIKLLHVGTIAFCAVIGMRFFSAGMRLTVSPDEPGIALRQRILRGWLLLYMFVGTQLAWTLRPFIGDPDRSFEWVRAVGGNFYLDVLRSVGKMLGI